MTPWLVWHKRQIAAGIAMIGPWIWMTVADRLLRRNR